MGAGLVSMNGAAFVGRCNIKFAGSVPRNAVLLIKRFNRLFTSDGVLTMNKSSVVLRQASNMKKHCLPDDEIQFERENIADWFDKCKVANEETLRAMRAHISTCLESATRRGDSAYYDARILFIEVVDEFLSHNERESLS